MYNQANMFVCAKSSLANYRELLYSLKVLRTKIFVDFMVFGAPMKFLSIKIFNLAIVA